MADWKMPVSYNFNPSYHAYAYGLMYPQVSEHGHPNLSWAEAAYTHSGGVTATYYSAQTTQQSPPWSPENGSASTYGQYQSHAQNGRLFLSYNKTETDPKAKDAEQAGSDTPSDSEAHTPDSWSSGSSREGAALTNLNLPSWGDRDYETDGGSPDSGEQISNSVSVAKEEPFQTETPRATQDPYSNPQVRESVFKRSPPQTPFYPSYPQPRSPTQATARPSGNWPLPPAVTHYEFPNPTSYMQARDGSNAANKDGSPTQMPSMPGATQWVTKGMTLL
ncbi:homeobox Hox-B5b-like protein [Labeo rohita]|uniref:Homeobox Hox-B5b-like protein n=1 Tax=Labeo rohita TaxID=84645 RepID=A0A498MZN4_LABRO|nr:homeobox Hox-B5b-like protein [Labeo rohita]